MTDSTIPPQSLHALYEAHYNWLSGWLRRKMGCPQDAADLAQDTYVRIIVSGRVPQAEQSRAYLVQVAKNLVIDLRRRRALERAYLDALAALPEPMMPSAEQQAVVVETLVEIDTVLDELPGRVRETFLLSQFDGLTYAEIAARLGISVGAVRKYMLRAATACLLALGAPDVDSALR